MHILVPVTRRLAAWGVERVVEAVLAALALGQLAFLVSWPGEGELLFGFVGVFFFYVVSGYWISATVISLLLRGLRPSRYRLLLIGAFLAHDLLFSSIFALGAKSMLSYLVFAMAPVGMGAVAVATLAGDWALARLGAMPRA